MNDGEVNTYDFSFLYLVHKHIQVKNQEKLAAVTSCLFSHWWRFGLVLVFGFVTSFVVFGLLLEFWGGTCWRWEGWRFFGLVPLLGFCYWT